MDSFLVNKGWSVSDTWKSSVLLCSAAVWIAGCSVAVSETENGAMAPKTAKVRPKL